MLKRIDHINLVVSDLEQATDFFRRLGFAVAHRGDLEGRWISAIVNLEDVRASYVRLCLPRSDVTLELIRYHHPPSPAVQAESRPNRIGIRHIAFEVEDIDKTVAALRHEGVTFFGDVQTYPETGKKLVYFHGPDDIIIELAQY